MKLSTYREQERPDVQTRFRKRRGTLDLIASIGWILRYSKDFQKKVSPHITDYSKTFDCMDHEISTGCSENNGCGLVNT